MKQICTLDLSLDKSSINKYLSNTLVEKISTNLKNNKKIILYINKRGAYDMLICGDCNYLEKCRNCDIALSIHKNPERVVCHHCGFSDKIPLKCNNCSGVNLKKIGVGTQQIEESLLKVFPEVNIFRFDSDNIKNISEKKEALNNISKAQIIVGTKMITTGFDIKNIGLIGVILVEQELQIPAYDTEEKIYSNIKQLIGRGGRVGESTDIVLQTMIYNNEFIKDIINLNYRDFFIKTLKERKIFNYPPFCELATIKYRNLDKYKVEEFISNFYNKLILNNNKKSNFDITKFDFIVKRNNQYYGKIIIKGENIRDFLEYFKKDILLNKDLVLNFE